MKTLFVFRAVCCALALTITLTEARAMNEAHPLDARQRGIVAIAAFTANGDMEKLKPALHAGLECGILSGKVEGLDCISFGPDLLHVHTPNERADIASVARVWEYLKTILAYKE